MNKNLKAEDIKKRLDFLIQEAQCKKLCSQIILEINIGHGNIGKSYINARTGIGGEVDEKQKTDIERSV
jgi:hypothetical protein